MPIDAATALADLDRLIEGIGAVQSEDGNPPVETRWIPIDFGQFEQALDSQSGSLSNSNQLDKKGYSDFGQFGQRISENDYTGPNPTDFGNFGAPEGGQYARTRVYNENTVQTVQTVQNGKSSFSDNALEFGQCLGNGEVTVQNPLWLYTADPACPPGDVPPDRWRQFLADARAFAGSPLAEQAAALGWTEDDLYGADDLAPFARRDKAGLLRLLNGNRLVEISEDVAVIVTRTGARQTYRRRRQRIGPVAILGEAASGETVSAEVSAPASAAVAEPRVESAEPELAEQLVAVDDPEPVAGAQPAVAVRLCPWIVDTTGDRSRRCGELIHDGRELCPTHRHQYAVTLLGEPVRSPLPFGPFPTGAVLLRAAE